MKKNAFLFVCLSAVLTLLNLTSCSNTQEKVLPESVAENATTEGAKMAAYNYTIPLSSFIYYNQGNTGCTNATYRANGCLPASCLMAAHLRNTSIPVTASRFTTYCAGMGTNSNGTTITNGRIYLKNNVFGTQINNEAYTSTSTSTTYDTGRTTTKDRIKLHLSSNYPVVALVKYASSSKTVTTSGNLNHFVMIVGLNETASGTGSTVYYYDPNNNSGLKSCDWSVFLNAMKTASAFNAYNFMRVG
ncbi:MAG: C39 family peptidase [Bacteroidia bacterium]